MGPPLRLSFDHEFGKILTCLSHVENILKEFYALIETNT